MTRIAMKTRSRSPSGFTLLELLIVMTIIAVLAGGIFAAGQSALKKARMVQALNMATALTNGISNFRQEYTRWPLDIKGADVTLDSDSAQEPVIRNLLGRETATSANYFNKRGINFIDSMPLAKDKKNGITYDSDGKSGTLADPWGQPFKIYIDGDSDDKIKNPEGGSPTDLYVKVAVLSTGADKTMDSSGGSTSDKNKDNVRTW